MKNKEKGLSFWSWLCIILAILLALRIYSLFTYTKIDVLGTSMQATLNEGDRLLVNRHKKAKRGDIVVIDVQKYKGEHIFNETTERIIKRLIATEGDSLYCRNNTIYIRYAGANEYVKLEEAYTSSATPNFSEVTVGEGEIYFLGDNRAISRDSTEVGCLKSADIYGVLVPYSVSNPWILIFF